MSRYKSYPQYKDSGVEWLGEVPENWDVKPLKFIAELNPKKSEIQNKEDIDCSFVPMEKLKTGKIDLDLVKPISDVYDGYTYFRNNDILLAKVTPCFENRNIAIASNLCNEIGFGSSEIYVIRVYNQSEKKYLFYSLQEETFIELAVSQMTGVGGLKRIPSEFLANLKFPFPSFEEQQSIAHFLDNATCKIDTLIQKQQNLISLLKEKRQALISHTVTKGLNPHAKMKDSGVEWLGEVPEHWTVLKIKYYGIYRSGDFISAEKIEDENLYPVFGGNGLRGYTDNYNLNGEYVLIGRQGALCGNINYAKGEFWATEHAIVVRHFSNIHVQYLGEFLKAMNLNQYSVSAAQPGLAVENIINQMGLRPPLEEQISIANYLDNATCKIDALISKAQQAIELLKERRTALISATVTGKIDVRNANE